MREILSDIDAWIAEENDIVLATVIQTWGSSPRKTGAKMAVSSTGRISGSVSGGCIEGAVVEAAMETFKNGQPQMLHFGVADEDAWEVGLACGGSIDVFVEVLNEHVYQFARRQIIDNSFGQCFTVIRGPHGIFGGKATFNGRDYWYSKQNPDFVGLFDQGFSSIGKSQRVELSDEIGLFVDIIQPSPTLIIVGGVHVAITLTAMAKMLDYRTIVVDPRRAFGSQDRFPDVDLLIQKWPQNAFAELSLTPDTGVVLLTHDPKIDDPALKILLDSPVFYIGALGSRKTHARRKERLGQMGFSEQKIAKIYAPVGLDIGAESPEEIALAVMAEVVQARRYS